jgi:hypothetical protein
MPMTYNAPMDRARIIAQVCAAACLLLALAWLAPGCHKQARLPASGGVSGQPARDEIRAGLTGKLDDERQFAMLFITSFKLPGYEQPLRELARDNPIAGVALASVYRNAQPLLDWRAGLTDQAAALNGVLGAVYGLGCAADIPEAMWDGVIEHTPPAQRVDLLWGMAQVSVEQSAQLALSAKSCAALEAEEHSLTDGISLEQRAAYDALLGGAPGHSSAWQDYAAQASGLQLTGTQWAALLRWAKPAQFRQVLHGAQGSPGAILALATATALINPDGVQLPWTQAQCRQAGAEVEYIACEMSAKREQTEAIQIFDALAQPEATGKAGTGAGSAAQPAPADAAQQGQALKLLSYAAARHDAEAVAYVLSLSKRMDPKTLGAVLATLQRYDRTLVTDAQLTQLAGLAVPEAAYWMVLGWPERQVVADSRMAMLVRVTPGQENAMLVYAFRLFQARKKATAG